MSDTLTPEEAAKEAVIAAAEQWRKGSGVMPDGVEMLRQAVDALRASRQPKGVKPEEVEPGTLFEFVPENARASVAGPYKTVLCVEPDQVLRWMGCKSGHVHGFTHLDRIIPIDPEDS